MTCSVVFVCMLCVRTCVCHPTATCSRAMLCVCIKWLISVRCSMVPLLIKRGRIISGDLTKDVSHIPDLEWWEPKYPKHYICNLKQLKIRKKTMQHSSSPYLSNFGEPLLTEASQSCSWLTEVKPDMVFCLCRPFALRPDMLCILSCFTAHHSCNFLSARTSLINTVILPTELPLSEIFPFFF